VLAIDAEGNSSAVCAAVWQITTDLFAVNCNKLVERFASWTNKQDGEDSPSDPGISPGENEGGILESAQVKMRVSGEAPGASSVWRARHRRGRQFKRRVRSSAADHNCPFRRQL